MRWIIPLATLLIAGLAGCVEDDQLRLVFVTTDDDLGHDKDPQRLASWVQAESGRTTKIHWVSNTEAILAALNSGQVDAAFLDGAAAWFAWQRFDMDVIAADLNSDGRAHYLAVAVVRADSDYQSMADLEGARSCHTGLLKSAGMFMPLGWLIDQGLATVVGNPDSLESIQPTAEAYFSKATIPEAGAPYSGYNGALQCLSEDVGDVAFVKDITVFEYCTPGHALHKQQQDWCLAPDQYRTLQVFGQVPSHSVVVRSDLAADKRADLRDALMALNGSPDGEAILRDVLETSGLIAVNAQEHLGDYGQNLKNVPGINQYVEDQLAK